MAGLLFISWQISPLFSGVVASWDDLKQFFITVSVMIWNFTFYFYKNKIMEKKMIQRQMQKNKIK